MSSRWIPKGRLPRLPLRFVVVAAALALAPGTAAPGEGAREKEQVADAPYPPEFRLRVNAAIEKGVARLKRLQREDGTWDSQHNELYPLAPTALVTLTLLKCGVETDDPAIVKAFEYLRSKAPLKTYDAGILLMAIAAQYEGTYDAFEPDELDRKGNVKAKSPGAGAISKSDLAWMKQGVEFLVNTQKATGMWRYPDGVLDISCTQYALLGLQAANRWGCAVPEKVWSAAVRFLVGNQEAQGPPLDYRGNEVRGAFRLEWQEPAKVRGFRYVPGWAPAARPTGSTTASGIACLMICQSELLRARRFDGSVKSATRRALRDALTWMQHHYDVATNPKEAGAPAETPGEDPAAPPLARKGDWYLYYLYGLAAAGVLTRMRFLGAHDWYLEGAEVLLKRQQGDGWGETTDTCFALLFLKRAATRHGAEVIAPFEFDMPAPAKPGVPLAGGSGGAGGGPDGPAK